MTDYMMKTRTALIWSFLVCILVAVVSQGAEEPSDPGLAMSAHPSVRLCNQMCRQKPVVDKCQCSSKAALPSNPCQNKKCRFGTRCTAFGSRPVCLPMPKACLLPQMRGLCTGTVIRYYFNHRSGNCEPFVFGGCSPNANNFISLQLCQKICMMIQG